MSTEAKTDSQDGGEGDPAAVASITQGLAQRAAKQAGTSPTAKPPESEKQPEGAPPAEKKPEEADTTAAPATPNTLEARLDALLKDNQDMRKRLEAVVKGDASRERQREGEDAREEYIRDYLPDIDRKLCRRLLPATTDKRELYKAAEEIDKALDAFMRNRAAKGIITFVNIGGNQGGKSISEFMASQPKTPQSPQEAIVSGLAMRRH